MHSTSDRYRPVPTGTRYQWEMVLNRPVPTGTHLPLRGSGSVPVDDLSAVDSLGDLADGLVGRPAWMREAACRGLHPSLFFGEKGEKTADVRAVCRACVVVDDCRTYAIDHTELEGVWGGLTDRERVAVRRDRRMT